MQIQFKIQYKRNQIIQALGIDLEHTKGRTKMANNTAQNV